MQRLAVAVGFAALLSFVTSSASLAQTSTTPVAPPPPAGVAVPPAAPPPAGTVTAPTGAAPQDATKPKMAEKQQLSKQQMRMKDCSHEAKAKGMKGDARKQFMSKCLKSE